MDKKIAYLFAGPLRTLIETGTHELINKYPGDVFFYSFDKIDIGHEQIVDDGYFKILSQLYPITQYKIYHDNDEVWANSPYNDRPYLQRLACAIYAQDAVYSMMKQYEKSNNFKYDIIIMPRTDIIYKNFDLTDLLQEEEEFVALSKGRNVLLAGIFGDHIKVCSADSFLLYLQAQAKILDDMPHNYSPESYVTTNVLDMQKQHGFKIKFVESDIYGYRTNGGEVIEVCANIDTRYFYKMLENPDLYQNAWGRVPRKQIINEVDEWRRKNIK